MRYKIGSFNMKNWGRSSARDFEKIADIIVGEGLDVVAFQEILSEGAGVKQWLETCVRFNLYDWGFCWGCPKESSDVEKIQEMIHEDRRGEGYAYIWNTRRFHLAETQQQGERRIFKPRILNSLSNDVNMDCSIYARTPYYIRLHPCYGGFFDLRLLNIHIYYGGRGTGKVSDDVVIDDIEKRKIEYQLLVQEIYPQISQKRYGDFRPAYTIAMGDYNLNIFRPDRVTQEKRGYLQEVIEVPEYGTVMTAQDQLSTLKKAKDDSLCREALSMDIGANNYDHFSYEKTMFSDVSCSVIEAVHKYCNDDLDYYRKNISDHLPVVIEIEL